MQLSVSMPNTRFTGAVDAAAGRSFVAGAPGSCEVQHSCDLGTFWHGMHVAGIIAPTCRRKANADRNSKRMTSAGGGRRRLDGVYAPRPDGGLRFARVKAPEREELEDLVQQIAERIARALERMGLLQRDTESA
ncbi:MAG: hypothetical protein ACKO4A_16460, partial [Gammaproteobacteria bacterium]